MSCAKSTSRAKSEHFSQGEAGKPFVLPAPRLRLHPRLVFSLPALLISCFACPPRSRTEPTSWKSDSPQSPTSSSRQLASPKGPERQVRCSAAAMRLLPLQFPSGRAPPVKDTHLSVVAVWALLWLMLYSWRERAAAAGKGLFRGKRIPNFHLWHSE